MIGRKPTHVMVTSNCEACGAAFDWKRYPYSPTRRFCRHDCYMGRGKASRPSTGNRPGKPRKLPETVELARLYLEDNLSTPEIARRFGVTDPHTVRTALLRAGVPMRRKTVALHCTVDGCSEPIHKIKHAGNGAEYGTLCSWHWQQHRRSLSKAESGMENTANRWAKIAAKLAGSELSNEMLWEQLKAAREEIANLREEINSIRPKDNKWGWLTWAMRRADVVSMRITAPSDADLHPQEIARIRSILANSVYHSFVIRKVLHEDIPAFELIKGRPFGGPLTQPNNQGRTA